MKRVIVRENKQTPKQEPKALNESTFRRIMDWINGSEIAIITAYRGKKENVVDSDRVRNDGKPEGYEYTRTEKRERNRELSATLIRLGYGVTKVHGVFVENYKKDNARLENEDSFMVINRNNDPDFYDVIFSLSEFYNQDCFCYKEKDSDAGYIVGTNKSDFPGYGNIVRNGKLITGVKNEFMTRLGNKGFAFTDIPEEELEPFETSHADRKQERIAKRLTESINGEFDDFSKYGVMGKQCISSIADPVIRKIKGN